MQFTVSSRTCCNLCTQSNENSVKEGGACNSFVLYPLTCNAGRLDRKTDPSIELRSEILPCVLGRGSEPIRDA